jgi:hypothetical protein
MKGVVMAELQEDFSGTYAYTVGNLRIDTNELEFDDVNKGEQPVQEIHIFNSGTETCQPNMMHLPPYLSATAFPELLNPGRSGKIVFTLNSEKIRDYGLTQTSVFLAQQLGQKVKSDIEVGVSAVLLPPVKQMENAPQLVLSDTALVLDFGGRSKKSGDIELTNIGHSRLDITSLQMFTRGLKVTLGKSRLMPGESTKLKITGVAADLKKARTAPRVLMITNDPKLSKVVITINSIL